MATSIADILEQIDATSAAMKVVADGPASTIVKQGMATSLASQLGHMDISLGDATKIASAIDAEHSQAHESRQEDRRSRYVQNQRFEKETKLL